MLTRIFIILLTCLFFQTGHSAVTTTTLRQKIDSANPGEYTVFSQGNSSFLVLIRHKSSSILIIEEVAFPSAIKEKIKSWQVWLNQNSPGHTSWQVYVFDLKACKVIHHYSYNRNCFLPAQETENNFLAKLLNLPLTPIPKEDQKKIGPAPIDGEKDYRQIWQPVFIYNGKQKKEVPLRAYTTTWVKDQTELAGCRIELYFVDSLSYLPIWIEIQSPHYAFKLISVDTGQSLNSPKTLPSLLDSTVQNRTP